MEEQSAFCSLGMFIIDEVEYVGRKPAERVIIGGAGSYAAIGARLAAGDGYARLVSWIVDVGSDFPGQFRSTIESWQTDCIFREDRARLTTRAWNGYSGENEHRAFKYLTPKIRLDQDSLSASQIMADSFHFVCSPKRCMSLVKGIMHKREGLWATPKASRKGQERPIMVWEPVPELCIPGERATLEEAIQYVDVLSPNTEELLGFFMSEGYAWSEEQAANEVLSWGIGVHQKGVLVVRQGSKGCTAYLRTAKLHLRPYHVKDGERPSRVVDPTGGGNAFLGGLAMAMNGKVTPSMSVLDSLLVGVKFHTGLLGALIYATIAASFVIEQLGMPLLSRNEMGQGMWNGERFEDRLVTYLSREHDYITQQLASHEGSISS